MPEMLSSILPENFHFAQSVWLWGLIILPVIWLLFALFYRSRNSSAQKLKDFADPHLIPHLLEDVETPGNKTGHIWRALALWSCLWILGVLALAGPRWDFTSVKAFAPASQLVLVLDMSRSMDAADIKPSRLARARQEIEDLMNANAGINYALIAFDAVPHMITPLSDDVSSIRRLLPSLTSDIVYSQGADLAAALGMAADMLDNAPGTNKHVLVLSDGEFESSDADIYEATRRLNKTGAKLHGFGFGSTEGAPIPDGEGGLVKDASGQSVISRLNEGRFQRIVQDGGGLYKRASYLSEDTNAILSQVRMPGAADEKAQKTTIFWEERFYIFLLPVLLLFLPFLRRGAIFPVLFAVVMMGGASPAHAFEWKDLFLNKEQRAARAVEEQKYDEAIERFDNPYQKGVAQYRAGDYQGAAQSFARINNKESGKPGVQEKARYNLGNAQLMGGRIEDAIKTYEDLLKDDPEHEDARHNLEIARKLLQQQQNQNQDKQNQSGGSGQNNQNKNEQNQDEQNKGDQEEQGGNGQQDGESDAASDQKGQDEAEGKKADEQGQRDKRKQKEKSGVQGDEDKRDQEQEDKDGQRKGQSAQQDENEERAEQDVEQQQTGREENGRQTSPRTQKDINADQWLERMESEPEQFLKNKFYIESQRAGASKGDNKW